MLRVCVGDLCGLVTGQDGDTLRSIWTVRHGCSSEVFQHRITNVGLREREGREWDSLRREDQQGLSQPLCYKAPQRIPKSLKLWRSLLHKSHRKKERERGWQGALCSENEMLLSPRSWALRKSCHDSEEGREGGRGRERVTSFG